MEWLQTQCEKINIRINSGGGTVLEALAIQAAIRNSKVPCDCYIDGIAASAAASIAVSGKKCYMADNGIFMIHNVVDSKGKADKAIIDVFNTSVATTLTARSKKTSEEIVELMNEETWMTPEQAKSYGFVDEILPTENKKKVPGNKMNNAFEIEALYSDILNESQNNPQNMKNVNVKLGLPEGASEIDAVNAISNKDSKIASLEAKVAALEKEKEDAEKKRKEDLKTKATNMVNKAKEEGKVEDSEVANLIENASKSEENYSFVENTLAKIKTTKEAKKVLPDAAKNFMNEERANWNFTKWSKEDPKGLLKMQNEAPELFKQIYDKEFKK